MGLVFTSGPLAAVAGASSRYSRLYSSGAKRAWLETLPAQKARSAKPTLALALGMIFDIKMAKPTMSSASKRKQSTSLIENGDEEAQKKKDEESEERLFQHETNLSVTL